MKLRPKLKLKVSPLFDVFIHLYASPVISFLHWFPFLFLERDPGNIDSLADLLLSDLKNFPRVRELGETSARFIREELEKTWGSSHLSVLSEEEAQKWLLGVCLFFVSFLFGLM